MIEPRTAKFLLALNPLFRLFDREAWWRWQKVGPDYFEISEIHWRRYRRKERPND